MGPAPFVMYAHARRVVLTLSDICDSVGDTLSTSADAPCLTYTGYFNGFVL